jgi:hypothetical protein
LQVAELLLERRILLQRTITLLDMSWVAPDGLSLRRIINFGEGVETITGAWMYLDQNHHARAKGARVPDPL